MAAAGMVMDAHAGALVDGTFRQFRQGGWQPLQDVVTREERIVVQVDGRGRRELWAWPQDLEPLALGHALLELCAAGEAPVLRRVEAGTFQLDILPRVWPGPGAGQLPGPWALEGGEILRAMEDLFAAGGLWQDTGCFHRAGLYDPQSRTLVRVVQDIGRHNCLDRLAGWALTSGQDPSGLVLLVSARLTASLAAKAARLGPPLVVSRSAVTHGALQLAEGAGLSVVGFCRQGRLTLFADPSGRVAASDKAGEVG